MSLFPAAAGWLADALATAAGVPVTYTRGSTGVALTAVVLSGPDVVEQPGERPVRITESDRVYSFRRCDLEAAGLFPPQPGDTVSESVGGAVRPFRVQAADATQDCWTWGEPERATVSVRCTERGG